MDAPTDVQHLVDTARQQRAEAEEHEARARDARDQLRATMAALVRAGMTRRAVARALNYRSDNSVRAKLRG